ncbi:site-specific DNA-methyltransferase [uncultured Ruegeria sp.]|uniref:DNA-methyltransferase n=1 Tax=uncultured Ruegeria sp. TaxID=259304 RepID=UPI00261549D4|nr:site-specific DNA-methyltransferase [uncultured Ruegeria sp.]
MTKQTIIHADSVDWMKDQPSSTYDLIISDPPYNVGKDYGTTVDSVTKQEYLEFLRDWTSEATRLLTPDGTIYVFMGFRFISYLYEILENECDLFFNAWICWHYTQGQGRRRGFSARHDDILMFTKHPKNFTFNLDDIRIPQKYYRSVNNMRGANPGDVWEFSHIHYCQGNRQAHPTQKPEGLIERMVLASSSKGSNVLDPFSGSGTTLRVCQQLSRNCTGIEINPEYVRMTENRLSQEFMGFDSIDPRMKRVPFDLRDPEIRQEYVDNHKLWFLKNHESDIEDFEKEVSRLYDKINSRKKITQIKGQSARDDLFSTSKTGTTRR